MKRMKKKELNEKEELLLRFGVAQRSQKSTIESTVKITGGINRIKSTTNIR